MSGGCLLQSKWSGGTTLQETHCFMTALLDGYLMIIMYCLIPWKLTAKHGKWQEANHDYKP